MQIIVETVISMLIPKVRDIIPKSRVKGDGVPKERPKESHDKNFMPLVKRETIVPRTTPARIKNKFSQKLLFLINFP